MKRSIAATFAIICTVVSTLSSPALAGERDLRVTPVVRAYRKAAPAVVNISTTKLVQSRGGMFGADPFFDIFPSPMRRKVPVQSLGSGFVIHKSGYIITNAHVIRSAEKITVTLADKSKHAARVISSDRSHDLAVLKIDPPKGVDVPVLPFGRSDDLMPGETVIAIGNPLGYANTITTGIVSALGRKLDFGQGVKYDGIIQTDAPINPGSSGGPLLNVHAELIGVTTAIRPDAQNIGFAIPVNALADELGKLLDFERSNRLIFGAEVRQRFTPAGAEVRVTALRAGTPAARKLRMGDRIVALDGRDVKQITDYTCGMLAVRAGQTVKFKCVRAGKTLDVSVTVKAKPRPDGKALAQKLFGVTLKEITPKLARDLRLPMSRGLFVVGMDERGPADALGLELKDVLFQVDKYYVHSLDELGMVLEDVRPGRSVKIGIARGRVRAWANITARRAGPPPTPPKRATGRSDT